MRTSFLIFLSLVFLMSGLIGCDEDPAAPDSDPVNHAPGQPVINTAAGGPANGATDCPISQALYWQCSDSDGDALDFDVYFGLVSPPGEVSPAQTAMSYIPGTLAYNTTYYWKIEAEDPDGASSSSAEWSFTTMAQPTETVSVPDTPTGLAAGNAGVSLDYTTGGSVSSMGHPVEYRFDWDDGTSMSPWSATTTVSHSWAAAGTYNVKAQARCATHSAVESAWSSGIDVVITVTVETVSTPGDVTGPATGTIMETPSYHVAASASSMGHMVEYQFDWGDGNFSPWAVSNGAIHNWPAAGSYEVKAQARCRDHTSIMSSWTAALTVVISVPAETLTRPTVTYYPDFVELGVEGDFVAQYATHSLDHPLEYQFDYGDGTIGPWQAATSGYSEGHHTYTAIGEFEVRARARCADHTTFESDWSNAVTVIVSSGAEVVSTPDIIGPALEDRTKLIGREIHFLMSGAASSHGHTLEYRFDLGDGTVTPWSLNYEYRYSYSAWGDYQVKGQARCRDHTAIETPWSDEITIHIVESITRPVVSGPSSGVVENLITFTTTGSTSSEGHALEYQFYISTSSMNPDLGFGGQGWSSSMELDFTFPAGQAGRYYVFVKARCATHTTVESIQSSYHSIMISN
jgi:hypothetical protein